MYEYDVPDLSVLREVAPAYVRCRFENGLSARHVDASLRQAVDNLDHAHGNTLLWFCEVDRRKLFADFGYPNMKEYALDRLGLSKNLAVRFAYLSSRLRTLPKLRSALAEGEIEWTKILILVQVMNSENEDAWIRRCRKASRADVKRMVASAKNSARNQHASAVIQADLQSQHQSQQQSGCRQDGTGQGTPRQAGRRQGGQQCAGQPQPGQHTDGPPIGRGARGDRPGDAGIQSPQPPEDFRLAPSPDERRAPEDIEGKNSTETSDPDGTMTTGSNCKSDEGTVRAGGVPAHIDPGMNILYGTMSMQLRFTPLQFARYEALREKLHKARIVRVGRSREEMLLDALGALLDAGAAGELANSLVAVDDVSPTATAACKAMGRPSSIKGQTTKRAENAGGGGDLRGWAPGASSHRVWVPGVGNTEGHELGAFLRGSGPAK